jgi:hypothetical protein
MEIKIVKDKILLEEVKKMAQEQYGDMVKAVVDVEKEIMAIGGELHADANEILIENEKSDQRNVWGINIYPEETENNRIVFDSLINIKPLSNNRTLNVENEEIKNKIKEVVNKLIK